MRRSRKPTLYPVDSIKVGPRFRKDLGDIASFFLDASIAWDDKAIDHSILKRIMLGRKT